jgi:hypothetical protein
VVSDPWDFKGPDGTNSFTGAIYNAISLRCIIFVSDCTVTFNEGEGRFFVLSSRYRENKDFEELHNLTVNGGLLSEDFDEALSEDELKRSAKFVFIGHMEKI